MTRTNGASGPTSRITNGSRKPRDYPAAIVSRLSSQAPRGSRLDRESFKQLLQGLLGTSGTQTSDGIAIEDDVNVNHDLIRVVVDAGFDTSHSDDPFLLADALKRQITESLMVIDLVVKRTPNVLFLEYSFDAGTEKEQDVFTFGWLISKLLPLLAKQKDQEIQGQVCSLLCAVVEAEQKCSQSRLIGSSILDFLQFCADDLILSIETTLASNKEGASTIQVSFPGSAGDTSTRLTMTHLGMSSMPSKVLVGNLCQTLKVLLTLHNAILLSISSQATPQMFVPTIRRDVAFFLDSLGTLWKLFLQYSEIHEPGSYHQHDSASLLTLLHKTYTTVSSLNQKISLSQRASLTLAQCVAALLGSDKLESALATQTSISFPLTTISQLSDSSSELRRAFEDLVIPVLVNLKSENRQFAPELQSVLDHISAEKPVLFEAMQRAVPEQSNRGLWPSIHQQDANPSPLPQTAGTIQGRPRKRLRLSNGENDMTEPSLIQTFGSKISTLLGTRVRNDIEGLGEDILTFYETISKHDQCELLQNFGRVVCAGAGTLNFNRSTSVSIANFACSLCDVPGSKLSENTTWHDSRSSELLRSLVAVFTLRGFQKCAEARVVAMLALRRIALHCPDRIQGVRNTEYGEWCVKSLQSSVRELRVAAGRALAAFLRDGIPNEICRQNRIYALEVLQNLLSGSMVPIQETSLLALGEIAQVCGDDELNIILIRLVESLGHENPYLSSLAYNQLLKLAQTVGDMPAGLLRPYWRTIAVTVAKNLHARPQIAQQLSELMGMPIPNLLVLIKSHTLPYLVLTKNVDIVRRIALAHKPEISIKSLLIQDDNFPAVLALLLMQPSSDPDKTILSLLKEFSLEFEEPLHKLVEKHTIRVACEILKAAGDAKEGKGSKAHQAFRLLASLTSSVAAMKTEVVEHFFKTNVLGIIKEFADTINEVQVRQPLTEKKRCLKATVAMVKLGKGKITSALPQISACLRSAMEVGELCDTAFQAWSAMTVALGSDDVEPLIDQTFSMVVRNWTSFSGETQDLAQLTIAHIFNHHSELLSDLADSIPSLGSIQELSQYEEEILRLKDGMDLKHQLHSFVRRCQNDNVAVVFQALTELVPLLRMNQDFLHQPSTNELPDPVVPQLTRAVLDCCVKFSSDQPNIAVLCAQCLGLIGCLDPNRIDATRGKKDILVLSNFSKADETIEFILFFLQEILVNVFLSAPNTTVQGFLAFAMQELLKLCELDSSVFYPSKDAHLNINYRRWLNLPELVRNTLTPFLTSRYTLKKGNIDTKCSYPLFHAKVSHYEWLQRLVLDMLQKANGENVKLIFDICSRIIRFQDVSIMNFLLPFTALNLVVNGTEQQRTELKEELILILQFELPEDRQIRENIISCSESIFQTLDYLSRWRLENKKQFGGAAKTSLAHGRSNLDLNLEVYAAQLASVEEVLNSIPAEIISKRAVECKSYARALFHWEQYIRQQKDNLGARGDPQDLDPYFERLQEIYSQIDEPDGIEGISAKLQVPDIEQQILEHQKAGRWTAAQSWYEIRLNENPDNADIQLSLLKCLKKSGQYDGIMSQIDSNRKTGSSLVRLLPFAVEASWITGRWDKLEEYIRISGSSESGDFNIRMGLALLSLQHGESRAIAEAIHDLRLELGKGLTFSSTSSLQSCHDTLLKLHVLDDVETILGVLPPDRRELYTGLDRRLQALGGYVSDKQYVLGLRRAAMQLCPEFSVDEIARTWVDTANLARKSNSPNQAVNAVLRASRLGSTDAVIQNARLLWAEGHHQKAIKTLEGFLTTHPLGLSDLSSLGLADSRNTSMTQNQKQKSLAADAQLLLAKWLDRAGQTSSEMIQKRYRDAIQLNKKWEKGYFSLGKYYNKLLDSEKAKAADKQADTYVTGEVFKLAIENYVRSMPFGFKYIFRSLPKILTLWLDLASSVDHPMNFRRDENEKVEISGITRRKKILDLINAQIKKYLEKIPACSLYTGLPQVLARICHSNLTVQAVLTSIIVKIVSSFPQQALWTLLAVCKSSSKDRSARGQDCLKKVQNSDKRSKSGSHGLDVRALVTSGYKLSDELLRICEADVHGKPQKISLLRDLGFNHKLAPCKLVVPIETTLSPSLPPNLDQDKIVGHAAFPQDTISISTFLDDVLVLSSLQKPRKLNVRGSDGKIYGLLCKPKDDLRKDQRLMEFNTMINRILKRDDESSKRKLYIKTYAVTPLNEECGLIEWVDNLRTLRDILLKMYKERNVVLNYNEIRQLLDEACYNETKLHIFADRILAQFRPVFYEWFVEMFPEPEQWFTARLRYTRSCAVMSMVGHVLGLGDRHGENILFQEDSGGTLHVDFNCLFDKGLTFEKPELVPFRLTHNMVDAFGAYGYDGPFRRSCELTMGLLRQNEDALMTIMETFLYDPTTDFIGKKKRHHANVPDTPAGVLESVRLKLRGLLPKESVPLSVGGHVDHLIRQAVDPKNLAAMYIGWCAFF